MRSTAMPGKQAAKRPRRLALGAIVVAIAACSTVIDGALSDKPAESAAAGGTTAGGGGGSGGGGGAGGVVITTCYDCGEDEICCVKSYDLSQLRCVTPTGPNTCDSDEINVECLTQQDCDGTVCCAQGDMSLVLQSVTCMDTCNWTDARLPVCTDNEPICGTNGYPSPCQSCGTLPEGLKVCWNLGC